METHTFCLNEQTGELSTGGMSVTLRPSHAAIVALFLEKPDQVLSIEDIQIGLRQHSKSSVSVATVVAYINTIRILLKTIGVQSVIQTKRNQGYLWSSDVSLEEPALDVSEGKESSLPFWTEEKIAQLRELVSKGFPRDKIAEDFRTSTRVITRRINFEGLSPVDFTQPEAVETSGEAPVSTSSPTNDIPETGLKVTLPPLKSLGTPILPPSPAPAEMLDLLRDFEQDEAEVVDPHRKTVCMGFRCTAEVFPTILLCRKCRS